jgi:O-antigen/teichoic acid export membrane protein
MLGSSLDIAVLKLATSRSGRDPAASLRIQKAALMGKLLGCIALATPILVFSHAISKQLFHQFSDVRLLILSLISLFGLLILRSVQTYFQVFRRFRLYGAADLLHSLAKYGGVGVFLALGVKAPLEFLLVYAGGPLCVGAVMLLTIARPIMTAPFSWSTLTELWRSFKWYLASGAAGSINTRMDVLLLSAAAATAQAGLFSAAQVVCMPFQLVGMYLAVVFTPRIMQLWEQGRLPDIYHRFQAWTIAGAVVIEGLAILLAGKLSALLLPPSYRGTTVIILLLLPSALTALINFPWTIPLLMFAHPRFLVAFEVAALPVLVVLYWLIASWHGAIGAAAVTSGFAVVKTIIYQVLASRTAQSKPESIRDLELVPDGIAASAASA